MSTFTKILGLNLCFILQGAATVKSKASAAKGVAESGQLIPASLSPETLKKLNDFEKSTDTLHGRFVLVVRSIYQPENPETTIIMALAVGNERRKSPTKDGDLGHLGTYSFFCDASCRKANPTTAFTIDATDSFYKLRQAKRKTQGKVSVLLWVQPPENRNSPEPSILHKTTASLTFDHSL